MAWDQGCDLGQVTTGGVPSLGDRKVAGGGFGAWGWSGDCRCGVAIHTLRLVLLLQLLMFWLLRCVSLGRPVDECLHLMADSLWLHRLIGNLSAWFIFDEVYARRQDINLLHNLEKNTKRISTMFFGAQRS